MVTLKEIVKDNTVTFSHYRAGYLYYEVVVNNETYCFSVPISDVGDATFSNTDKAIYFLRYIRKAVENESFVIVSNNDNYTTVLKQEEYHDDIIGTYYIDVAYCCGIGPIIHEKYCPNCGRKIIKI